MNTPKSGYVDIDALQQQADLADVLRHYGVEPSVLSRTGSEFRSRCFLACGRECDTGDRALAIRADDPLKRWHCHHYGCGRGGNLVSLCDLLKGGPHQDGRPRGERFRAIRDDLRSIVEGVPVERPAAAKPAPDTSDREQAPQVNIPLARSPNERARALVDLDAKLVTDPARMPPAAAAYFRSRPFLTPEVCQTWRMGYLPQDGGQQSGGDRSGGSLRGRIVYGYQSVEGEILTWFGRDPQFERNHSRWSEGGRTGREPVKTRFVKGFHRGQELFGQHADRLQEPGFRESLAALGLIVVEGPNDVIALDALGVPAVGLCGSTVTRAQVEKLTGWVTAFAGGTVTLMPDCDAAGENGARRAVYEIAEHCRVRVAWSPSSHEGRFAGRQPESLSPEEWQLVRDTLPA